MKRIAALVFALLLFALSACNSAEKQTKDTAPDGNEKSNPIVTGAGLDYKKIYSEFTDEEKETLKEYALTQNVEVSFTDDGTTVFVFTENDGFVVKQDSKGKFSTTLAGDETVSAGFQSNWPKNDFTAKLPDPPFKVVSVSESGNMLSVMFESFDRAAAVAYVEELTAVGFTFKDEFASMDTDALYTYAAENAEGDRVSISTTGVLTLVLANKT